LYHLKHFVHGTWAKINGNCSKACAANTKTAITLTATNTAFAANYKNWIGIGWQFISDSLTAFQIAFSGVQVFLTYTCNTSTLVQTSAAFKPSFTTPFYFNGAGSGLLPLPYAGIDGDIWEMSFQYDQIVLCGSNTTVNKPKITSAKITATLLSNVSVSIIAQMHYFIPISKIGSAGNTNMTTYCSTPANFPAPAYNNTCKNLGWGPNVPVNITGCPNY